MMPIEYPVREEILRAKEAVLQTALPRRRLTRPGLRTVFGRCAPVLLISFGIYLFLLGFCLMLERSPRSPLIVLLLYPLTYYSFYFLSFRMERENGVIELKQSFKYAFHYLICLRMLYFSVLTVYLNLLLITACGFDGSNFISLAAAGTSAQILSALFSLILYEKTGSVRCSAVLPAVWITACIVLLRYSEHVNRLLMEIIPLSLHIIVAVGSLAAFLLYTGKVEWKNAYDF